MLHYNACIRLLLGLLLILLIGLARFIINLTEEGII